MANNHVFWNQMLMRSDSIVDIDASASDAVEQVLAQLATVTEQFDRVFDPADQFEEYVAVALCQALQRALTPKTAKPVCKVSVQNKALNTASTTPAAPQMLDEAPSMPQPQSQPQSQSQPQPQPQTKHRPKKHRSKRR